MVRIVIDIIENSNVYNDSNLGLCLWVDLGKKKLDHFLWCLAAIGKSTENRVTHKNDRKIRSLSHNINSVVHFTFINTLCLCPPNIKTKKAKKNKIKQSTMTITQRVV